MVFKDIVQGSRSTIISGCTMELNVQQPSEKWDGDLPVKKSRSKEIEPEVINRHYCDWQKAIWAKILNFLLREKRFFVCSRWSEQVGQYHDVFFFVSWGKSRFDSVRLIQNRDMYFGWKSECENDSWKLDKVPRGCWELAWNLREKINVQFR